MSFSLKNTKKKKKINERKKQNGRVFVEKWLWKAIWWKEREAPKVVEWHHAKNANTYWTPYPKRVRVRNKNVESSERRIKRNDKNANFVVTVAAGGEAVVDTETAGGILKIPHKLNKCFCFRFHRAFTRIRFQEKLIKNKMGSLSFYHFIFWILHSGVQREGVLERNR